MGYNSKQLKVQYHTKDAPNPKPNPYKGDKQVNPLVNKSYIDPTGNGMRDPRIKALAQQFGIPITIPGQSMGTNGYGNDMPLRVTPNYADGSQGPEYTKYPNTGDHSFPGAVSFTERSMASGGQTNSDIARAILEDGMVYGYSLSDSQMRHMAEQAGVELDEDGNIVEAEDADDSEMEYARRGGQKRKRKKTSSNPVTGINDLMMRNETIYGKSGKKRFVPKLQQGGWLDEYQPGGAKTPEEWEKQIRTVEHTIGNPSQWDMQGYNLLQNKLNDYKNWRENTPEGRAVHDSHNEPNEYVVPLPPHLAYAPKIMKQGGGLDKYQPGGAYNMERALELGYTPDETSHWPSVDSENGMWLKSKEHPTAWMEYMYGQLNPEIANAYNVRVNPEGYFGNNQLQYVPKKEMGGGLDQYQVAGQVPRIDPSLMGTSNFASETIRIPESLKEDPFLKAKRISDYNNKKNAEKKALAEKYYNERKNQKMMGVKGTPEELDKINKDVAEYSASNNVDNSRIPLSERVGDFATDMALNLIGTGAYTSLGKGFSALAKEEQVASGLSKFIPKELPGSPNAWKPPTKPLIIKNEADEIIYQYDPADYQNFNTPEMYNQAKNDLQFVVQRDSKKELERMAMLEKYGIKTEGDFQQYQRKLDTDLIKYNNDMGTDLNVRNPNPTQADMFTGSTDVPSFNQKIKELKAVGEHGKQPLLTKENFYNQADVTKMTQQHQDYYKALDEYEKLNPQTGADMFMGVFNGNNPYMETFHNLNPNLQAPKWGEKFWGNLDDTKMLNETLPYAPGVKNSLSPSSLKYMGSSENKLLPNAKNLVNRSDDWFHKASKRDYLMEMRGSLGLKPSDIKNMSNAEIELNAQKIYDKIGKQEVERYLKDVSTPYTGKEAYKTLTPNKFGGKTGGWLDNYK